MKERVKGLSLVHGDHNSIKLLFLYFAQNIKAKQFFFKCISKNLCCLAFEKLH